MKMKNQSYPAALKINEHYLDKTALKSAIEIYTKYNQIKSSIHHLLCLFPGEATFSKAWNELSDRVFLSPGLNFKEALDLNLKVDWTPSPRDGFKNEVLIGKSHNQSKPTHFLAISEIDFYQLIDISRDRISAETTHPDLYLLCSLITKGGHISLDEDDAASFEFIGSEYIIILGLADPESINLSPHDESEALLGYIEGHAALGEREIPINLTDQYEKLPIAKFELRDEDEDEDELVDLTCRLLDIPNTRHFNIVRATPNGPEYQKISPYNALFDPSVANLSGLCLHLHNLGNLHKRHAEKTMLVVKAIVQASNSNQRTISSKNEFTYIATITEAEAALDDIIEKSPKKMRAFKKFKIDPYRIIPTGVDLELIDIPEKTKVNSLVYPSSLYVKDNTITMSIGAIENHILNGNPYKFHNLLSGTKKIFEIPL